MKFFKPEDFTFSAHPKIPSNKWDQMTAANIANEKIIAFIDGIIKANIDSTSADDPYFVGMTNGMLVISACISGEEKEFAKVIPQSEARKTMGKVLIMIFGFGKDSEVIYIKDMDEVGYWYNRRIEKWPGQAFQMFVCDEKCELDCGPYQSAYNKKEADFEKEQRDEKDRREFERLKKKFNT